MNIQLSDLVNNFTNLMYWNLGATMKLKKYCKDNNWDRLLRIRTAGWDGSNSDNHHYPYEPTDYPVLERLAASGHIGKKNTVLDYGSGKGRVGFFLTYQTKCNYIGVEYDGRIYDAAIDNRNYGIGWKNVDFHFGNAEEYIVPVDVDRCYFFNPFSVEILSKVLSRILDSYYVHPRKILLFFYYPSDEYISFLMNTDELFFFDEIDCSDLFEESNMRERIMIFSID